MKKIILVLLCVIGLAGCSDFLYEKPKGEIEGVIAYPSPAREGYINFANLPEMTKISIYTPNGDLIERFNGTGATVRWDFGKLANGVYIAVIDDEDGNQARIKFAVLN